MIADLHQRLCRVCARVQTVSIQRIMLGPVVCSICVQANEALGMWANLCPELADD